MSIRDKLMALVRRSRHVVLFAAVTGVIVGAVVAVFEWLTAEDLLGAVRRQPLWAQALAPLAGLVLAAAALRWLARGASPATADEYVRNFHDRHRRMPERPVPGRLLAAVATLGLGGSLGFEGPSIYLGAAIGSGLQRRLTRFFSREDAKVLLVCGAAAGVAAIFKAPATGVVFALEAPYQDDLAHRMLIPAGAASATGYLTFALFAGTEPLFPVFGAPPFNLLDLGGAALLGLLCGMGARGFVIILRRAKRLAAGTIASPGRWWQAGCWPGSSSPDAPSPARASPSAPATRPSDGHWTRAVRWPWWWPSWRCGRRLRPAQWRAAAWAASSCPWWSSGP